MPKILNKTKIFLMFRKHQNPKELLKLIKIKKKASEANPDGRTENTENTKAKNKYFALATNNNNSKSLSIIRQL